ncbi:hypothetical protein EG812_01900 [Verrucosispora sp. FIM060022]|nr:hypothetical protein EG812_01900 [Verrucosispora sp. FIM060022]
MTASAIAAHDDSDPARHPCPAGPMYEAMRDLYHLNPHDGPDPRTLFNRFLAWGPPRRRGSEASR